MSYESTNLISYASATALASTYRSAVEELKRCLEQLDGINEKMLAAFNSHRVSVHLSHSNHHIEYDDIACQWKRDAWRHLFHKLELHKVLSSSRASEMNDLLTYGRCPGKSIDEATDELPDITPENIEAVLRGWIVSADEFFGETVLEIFEWLRPDLRRDREHYKTNNTGHVGRKVVVSHVVRCNYRNRYDIEFHYQPRVTSLDTIFSVLDGKGPVKSHYGPLSDAINATETGSGKTDYFAFRVFKNGNLHLTFLRPDLLAEFNLRAGNARMVAGKKRR